MAKKNKKQRKEKVAASSSGAASEKNKIAPDDENKITWEAVAAMSDSDDDGNDDAGIELNSKAKDLRQAIAEGKFDGLLSKLKADAGDDDEDDFEEDVLDGSSSDEEEQAESGDGKNAEEQSDDSDQEDEDEDRSSENEEEEEDEEDDDRKAPASLKDLVEGNDSDQEGDDKVEMDEEKEDEADDAKMEKYKRLQENNNVSSKALGVVTAELAATHAKMPWAETFVIIPSTPLPFGENGDPEANPLDIHDDLKREVAFYNTALEAVHQAREECKKANVPFSRPDDFFAEMVKTDNHMAKVKDRLIFETKKIEAVAQRKANKEQKLRVKESQANRLAEKSKRKREHFQEVEDWANSVAKHRGGALRDDMDDQFLNGRNKKGPNKKRVVADRKFGFGGKKGRFKQNDRQSMNDVSGFNPRGNFPGGMKKVSGASKSGAGGARPGKRARDAKRARR